jgi:asparagine synthase (glutamine-hydrolysing)
MCGICGICNIYSRGRAHGATAADMCSTLHHRGPDDRGVFAAGPVALAMARLSIIDLAGGHQPLHNEDGSVTIVYNGETYNAPELRAQLEGRHDFATRSDTEVLVHAYEEWGEEMLGRLRGMFAFAIWDDTRQSLLLARDRLGIKPLYYALVGDWLAFGSEIKAVLRAPGVERRLDPEALHSYLSFNYIPAPMTIYRGLRKLPPGHLLRCGGGQMRLRQYWDLYGPDLPGPYRPGRDGDEQARADELRGLLDDAVRAHLLSDVPVGVLLSGGIDSSAVVALAARAGGRVKTFSIGFEEKSFNELEAARLVARAYGTDHHEDIVTPDAAALIERIADHFDEPFADSSALPTFLVSQMAAREVKVVLSGDGGDEIFGGYLTYSADDVAQTYQRIPHLLRRRLIEPLVARLPVSDKKNSLDYLAKRFVASAHLPPLERHHAWRVIFTEVEKRRLYSRDWRAVAAWEDPLAILARYYESLDGRHFLTKLQYVDTKTYLPDDILTKVDRMSMAHSLETRPPLLDHRVVEYAASLPAYMKVRGLQRKRVLRRAVGGLLPPPLLRRRKHGFSIPAAAWLRGELRPLLLDLLSPAAVRRCGVFDPAAVAGLIDDHLAGRRDLSRNLWGLLMFMVWHERYLRSTCTPAPAARRQPAGVCAAMGGEA